MSCLRSTSELGRDHLEKFLKVGVTTLLEQHIYFTVIFFRVSIMKGGEEAVGLSSLLGAPWGWGYHLGIIYARPSRGRGTPPHLLLLGEAKARHI